MFVGLTKKEKLARCPLKEATVEQIKRVGWLEARKDDTLPLG